MSDFYKQLAPFYHLIYDDWEASIAAYAELFDSFIQTEWGPSARAVLDVSCGIGTQSIALSTRGYRVTASDLSPDAVARAAEEARARQLSITFSVCDMHRLQGAIPYPVPAEGSALLNRVARGSPILVCYGSSFVVAEASVTLSWGDRHAKVRLISGEDFLSREKLSRICCWNTTLGKTA